jgi:hypothetical protein
MQCVALVYVFPVEKMFIFAAMIDALMVFKGSVTDFDFRFFHESSFSRLLIRSVF